MKKSRLFLATGVFALAFGAAFATKANKDDALLGYAQLATSCQLTDVPIECGTEHANICTVDEITYFVSRKGNDPSVCVTEYRKP
ncbi:hypothetical protein SAMN05216480_12027 [Pustulibacterium marinum]|uniref:NVEALA protein n=1 Tax=Pustulibacterium marinum TaxID=1224947 RepID=A0A1I7IRL8_9FLAO|nr:DUF6520 family protein [Pustulibacterium marinum]SFU75580.1 hypothetical protein SAMN05216480_12027 [Pustulibacterium marinum]